MSATLARASAIFCAASERLDSSVARASASWAAPSLSSPSFWRRVARASEIWASAFARLALSVACASASWARADAICARPASSCARAEKSWSRLPVRSASWDSSPDFVWESSATLSSMALSAASAACCFAWAVAVSSASGESCSFAA